MSGKFRDHSKLVVLFEAQAIGSNGAKLDQAVDPTLLDYYRMPVDSLPYPAPTAATNPDQSGFFQFGKANVCYGHSESGVAKTVAGSAKFPARMHLCHDNGSFQLPFSFAEVIDNLRLERYQKNMSSNWKVLASSEAVHRLYYLIRSCFPATVRCQLQKLYFSDWMTMQFPAWPVDFTVDNLHKEYLRVLMEGCGLTKVPFIWFWPDGAANCLIMTHDVETLQGRNFTSHLMDLDDSYGFKSSFEVIPEKRYEVPDNYVHEISKRGFEFNVHDLNHDGRLYLEREEFLRRAKKINDYIRHYGASGFRAGSMYRRTDWFDDFEFSYDMSLTNVAHLEPQRGGCCTVFPFFIGKILEIPLTTSQDYAVFHILNDYSIEVWKKQIDLIRQRNGLMSFLTHPDYLIAPRARKIYESLLDYLRETIDREKIWTALPGEVDRWWRTRSQLQLVQKGDDWEIQGAGKERARIAYAIRGGDRLIYEVADAPAHEGSRR